MKKFLIGILIILSMLVVGCGDSKVINDVEYETYGFINKTEERNSNIKYRIVYGNVVWSFLLANTIIAPAYFVGFSLYEPVRELTYTEMEIRKIN